MANNLLRFGNLIRINQNRIQKQSLDNLTKLILNIIHYYKKENKIIVKQKKN